MLPKQSEAHCKLAPAPLCIDMQGRRSANDDVDARWELEELNSTTFGTEGKEACSHLEAVELDLNSVRKPRRDLDSSGGQVWSDAEQLLVTTPEWWGLGSQTH